MKEIGENLGWTIVLPIFALCLTFGLIRGCDIYQTKASETEIAKYENGYEAERVISSYQTIWVKAKTDTTSADTLK